MAKPFIFTLMPFDESFDDIYKLGIKPTCEDAGAYCERVDEQIFQGSILDRILNQISKADVIVGDMSNRNPNVFFEVGYAKALDKKIVLLTADASDIPFDLKHYAHVVYGGSIVTLKENLKKHIEFYLNNLTSSGSEIAFGLNVYAYNTRLVGGELTEVTYPKNYRYLPLSIENVSGKSLPVNSYQLTASGYDDWLLHEHDNRKYVAIPDGKETWSINNETPHFNGATETYMLCGPPRDNESTNIVSLSIYTENGCREFKVRVIASDTDAN